MSKVPVVYSISREAPNHFEGNILIGGITIRFYTRFGGDHPGFWNLSLRGFSSLTRAQRAVARQIFTATIGDLSAVIARTNVEANFDMTEEQRELLENKFGCVLLVEVKRG